MSLAGCILAGGRSSRFGSDKALAIWRGKTLLAHAAARLRPQTDMLVISANSAAPQYSAMGAPVIADRLDGFQGPLAGVLTALSWAKAQGAPALVTAAADTPLFPLTLARGLAEAAQGGIAVAQSDAGLHPTFAFWPVTTQAALVSFLSSGQSRRMTDFLQSEGFKTRFFDAEGALDPFFNINTPDDLAKMPS